MVRKLLHNCLSADLASLPLPPHFYVQDVMKLGTNSIEKSLENILEVASMISVRVKVRRDDHSVGKLAAGEVLLRFLAVEHGVEFHEDLAHSGDFNPFDGPGNLHGTHNAIATALLPNVFLDVLVFLIVLQFLWRYLIKEDKKIP